MNLQLVVHPNHTDRFEEYSTRREQVGDNGILLSLIRVQSFDVDDMGRIAVDFRGGDTAEVPYGTLKRGYDEGV